MAHLCFLLKSSQICPEIHFYFSRHQLIKKYIEEYTLKMITCRKGDFTNDSNTSNSGALLLWRTFAFVGFPVHRKFHILESCGASCQMADGYMEMWVPWELRPLAAPQLNYQYQELSSLHQYDFIIHSRKRLSRNWRPLTNKQFHC